jgi:hypothetical protein
MGKDTSTNKGTATPQKSNDIMSSLGSLMPKEISNMMGGFGSIFGAGGSASGGAAAGGAGGAMAAGGAAGAVAGVVIELIKGIVEGVKKLVDLMRKASPILEASFKMLQLAFMMALKPLGDLIGMFLMPIAVLILQLLMPFIRAIAPYMAVMFRTWMKMGADIANAIVPFLVNTVVPFIMKMLPIIQPLLDFLMEVGFAAVIGVIMVVIDVLMLISGFIQGLKSLWETVLMPIWNEISKVLGMVWDGIVDVFNALMQTLKPIWDNMYGVLQTVWRVLNDIWNWFTGTLEGILSPIKGFTESILRMFGLIPSKAEGGFTGKGGLTMLHPNEWVFNENQMKSLLSNTLAAGQGSTEQIIRIDVGGITINGGVGGLTVEQIAKAVDDSLSNGVRRRRRYLT